MFYWRLHKGLLGDRAQELEKLLVGEGDIVQLVEGPWLTAPNPLPSEDGGCPGLALTTIQDARRLLKDDWCYPRILYFDTRKYNVSYWMPRLDANIPVLNRRALFIPAGLLPYQGVQLDSPPFRTSKGRLFIRPDSGFKTFTGFVLDTVQDELHSWSAIADRLKLEAPGLAPDTIICVASAQPLHTLEWRFWIVNGEVVASTPYSWENDLDSWLAPPEGAMVIARQMAANYWQPDMAYVVDVVQTKNQRGPDEFFLNELNACSTAGTYHVPFEPLITALRNAVLAEVAGVLSLED